MYLWMFAWSYIQISSLSETYRVLCFFGVTWMYMDWSKTAAAETVCMKACAVKCPCSTELCLRNNLLGLFGEGNSPEGIQFKSMQWMSWFGTQQLLVRVYGETLKTVQYLLCWAVSKNWPTYFGTISTIKLHNYLHLWSLPLLFCSLSRQWLCTFLFNRMRQLLFIPWGYKKTPNCNTHI